MTLIDEKDIADLSARFSGVLLRPGQSGYDDVRRIHNGMIDRRPALIARCLGSADIADAVNFARTRGLELAVRGGGTTRKLRMLEAQEAQAFRDLQRGFSRMTERLESLETLYMGRSQGELVDRESE